MKNHKKTKKLTKQQIKNIDKWIKFWETPSYCEKDELCQFCKGIVKSLKRLKAGK